MYVCMYVCTYMQYSYFHIFVFIFFVYIIYNICTYMYIYIYTYRVFKLYKEVSIVPTKWSDVDMARLAQLANVHRAYRTCLDRSTCDLWIQIPQNETNKYCSNWKSALKAVPGPTRLYYVVLGCTSLYHMRDHQFPKTSRLSMHTNAGVRGQSLLISCYQSCISLLISFWQLQSSKALL